jgi:hypothetical protein
MRMASLASGARLMAWRWLSLALAHARSRFVAKEKSGGIENIVNKRKAKSREKRKITWRKTKISA